MEGFSEAPLLHAIIRPTTLPLENQDDMHALVSNGSSNGFSNGRSVSTEGSPPVVTQLEAKGFVHLSKILNRLHLLDVTLDMGSENDSNPVFLYYDNPYLGWRRAVHVTMSGNQAGRLTVIYNPPALNNNLNRRINLRNKEELASFLAKKGLPPSIVPKFEFGVRCVCQRPPDPLSNGTEYVKCALGKAGCNGFIHKEGCVVLPPNRSGKQEYICPLCTNYLVAIGEDQQYRNSNYIMIEKACCEGSAGTNSKYTVKLSPDDDQTINKTFFEYTRPHPSPGFWNKRNAPKPRNSVTRMNGKMNSSSSKDVEGASKGNGTKSLNHVLLSKVDEKAIANKSAVAHENNSNSNSRSNDSSSSVSAGNGIMMSAPLLNGSGSNTLVINESNIHTSTANGMLPVASQLPSTVSIVESSKDSMISRGINLVTGVKIARPRRSLIANLQLENAIEDDNIDSGDEHTVPTFQANADSMYFDRWATYPDGRRVLVRVDGGWMKRGENATALINNNNGSSSSTGITQDQLLPSYSNNSLNELAGSTIPDDYSDILSKLTQLERSSRAAGTGLHSTSASLKAEWIDTAMKQIPRALENERALSKHYISRNHMFSWMPLEDGTIRHVSALPAGNFRSLHLLCTSCRLCAYCLHSLNVSEKVAEHQKIQRLATNRKKSPHERIFLRKFGSVEYHVHESCAFIIDNIFSPIQERPSLDTISTTSTTITTSSTSDSLSLSSSSYRHTTEMEEDVDMSNEYTRVCASIDKMKRQVKDFQHDTDMNMDQSSTAGAKPIADEGERDSLFRNIQGNPFDSEVDRKEILESNIFGSRQMWLLEDHDKDRSDDDDDEMDESDGDTSPSIVPSFPSSSFSSSHHENGMSAADRRAIESVVTSDRVSNQWSCGACTYSNLPRATKCELCQTPRPHNYSLAAVYSSGSAFADDAISSFDHLRKKDNIDSTVSKIPAISNLVYKGTISNKDLKNYLSNTKSTVYESLKLQDDANKTGSSAQSAQPSTKSTQSTASTAATTTSSTTATTTATMTTASGGGNDRNCCVTCTNFFEYEPTEDFKKCDLCQKSGAVLQSYTIEINSKCRKEGVAHPACINWFERSKFLPLIKSKVEHSEAHRQQRMLDESLNNEVDRCCICASKGGIIVRCAGAGCAVQVHPVCAIILGGDWRVCEFAFKQSESSSDTSNTGEVVGILCPSHGVRDSPDRSTVEDN